MDSEKIIRKLVTATFILSVATLVLAVTVLIKDFIPADHQPVAKAQQPAVKISKSYAKRTISLDKAMAKNKPVAIFFYVDWCGYCQRFAPVFKELTKNRDLRKNYTFVYVNCEDQKNSAYVQEYDVHAYPTLFLVNPTNKDKAQVANRFMFTSDATTVLQEQFNKFVESGSKAVTQPDNK